MKINRNIVEATWVDYDADVSFKVRQFPLSQGMWLSGNNEEFMEFNWKRFNYALIDWKGFTNEKDEVLECNEESKRFVYDYIPEISLWITAILADVADTILEKKT